MSKESRKKVIWSAVPRPAAFRRCHGMSDSRQAHRRVIVATSDLLAVHAGDREGWGGIIVKARTLLLMCGLSLAGVPAAGQNLSLMPVSVRDAGGGRVRIEAHDASVGQVLAALQESGLIRFSASDQLSRTVSGTYTGTLPQVLSRILDGTSYFLRVTASGTELHAVDASRGSDAPSRSASGDSNATSPGVIASNVEAAPAPVPAAAFALSTANPVSKARARERALRSARTR